MINPFVKLELVSRHTRIQASALQTFADDFNKRKHSLKKNYECFFFTLLFFFNTEVSVFFLTYKNLQTFSCQFLLTCSQLWRENWFRAKSDRGHVFGANSQWWSRQLGNLRRSIYLLNLLNISNSLILIT